VYPIRPVLLFHTTDADDLAEEWARLEIAAPGGWDTLEILIDGYPSYALSDEASDVWDKLNAKRGVAFERRKQELAEAKRINDIRQAEYAEKEAARKARLQHLVDLAVFEALSKKLGINVKEQS
jgi:hypothetical protein